jgi:PncC family amidohydrolase
VVARVSRPPSLEERAGRALRAAGAWVAVAESCTGGLLGARLTAVPGSSGYFLGGVLAYHNRVKAGLLGVPSGLLRRHGAVSAPCAAAMAHGVRRALGSDYGVAITGIAGPGGGTPARPVGLVFVAVARAGGARWRRAVFAGDRGQVREQSVELALNVLLSTLQDGR